MEPNVKKEMYKERNLTSVKRKPAEMLPEDSTPPPASTATPKRARGEGPPSSPYFATTPTTTSKSFRPARNVKSSPATPQSRSQATPKSSTRKSRIPADPINIAVYELRKEGLGWDEIAIRTNTTCNLSSEHELTGPACYSRFFRNGPLVAKDRGEPYQKDWYLHMKGPVKTNQQKDGEASELKKQEVAAAAEAADQASELEEELEQGAEQAVGAEGVSQSMKAEIVKTVEHEKRMFWEHVAEIVNAKFADEEALTDEEAKEVYDRVMGNGA